MKEKKTVMIEAAYYNGQWNINLKSEDIAIEKTNEQEQRDERGSYRLSYYDNGIYSYGYTVDNDADKPGHGGEWSSNTARIGHVFGIDLIAIGVNGFAKAINVNTLKSWLPDGMKMSDDGLFNAVMPDGDTPKYMEKRSFVVELD